MIDAIKQQLQSLTSPINRVKTVLRVRDAVASLPGARFVVTLEKLTARLEKAAKEFLTAIDTTPELPGISALVDAAADSEGGEP